MIKRSIWFADYGWLMAILFLAVNGGAFAQQKTPETASQPTPQTTLSSMAKTPAPAATAKSALASPVNPGQALYLVRSTLMMLNDANRSGNYTVLRDLAAPDFQNRNTAADLAQIFFDLRRRKFDLFAVSFASPQFSGDPSVDSTGKVRLTGVFPTRPLQIKFDLTFQSVDGQWKLFAIWVATPDAPKDQSFLLHPPSQQRTAKPFYGFQLFRGTAGWRW